MRGCISLRRAGLALTVLAAAMLLPAAEVARADTQYKMQPIVKVGDTAGGVHIRAGGGLMICGLTDRGQITFEARIADDPSGMALMQYADGKFFPIAVAGREGPVGTWPEDFVILGPASMNPLGNVVFAAGAWNDGDLSHLGTFGWDARSGKVTPMAREGMPAVGDLVFETGGWWSPVINGLAEVAIPTALRGTDGSGLGIGILLTGPDGRFVPIAVPGQDLPEGGQLAFADTPSLNDAGMVAFRGNRENDPDDGRLHAYLWEKGKLTLLAAARTDAPGGGKIARVQGAWVNDKTRSVLIAARRNDPENEPTSLYLWTEGKLTAVAVPGQEMPGGGQFRAIPTIQIGVSPPNRLGQHAFLATLQDGATAAYLMDADGKLSLILKSGTLTDLGRITRIGPPGFIPGSLLTGGMGVGLNSQGQVAVPMQIDGGPDTIVLLTPVAP